MTAAPARPQYLPLEAPAALTAEVRFSFRQEAIAYLEAEVRRGAPAVVITLRDTISIDSHGMGLLVLLQKRAREAGVLVHLLAANTAVRAALRDARMDHLFRFVG